MRHISPAPPSEVTQGLCAKWLALPLGFPSWAAEKMLPHAATPRSPSSAITSTAQGLKRAACFNCWLPNGPKQLHCDLRIALLGDDFFLIVEGFGFLEYF